MNTTPYDGKPQGSAIILRFPRKRGRPRSTHPASDTGTPELVMKRAMGETAEALDLCLERGIISREQHWCGIHLRWLYTLRHGAPGVRAIDPTHLGGIDAAKQDDPEWRSAREKEYHEAMKKLMARGHAQTIMSLCIFNERPSFLSLHKKVSPKRLQEVETLLSSIRDGLDILCAHWGKRGRKK